MDSTAFARTIHSHDAAYVNEGQADSIDAAMLTAGAVTTAAIRDNAVTADKVSPAIVSSLDGVVNDGGNIDLVAGSNVTITPNDGANTITISAAGGGTSDHASLTGLSDDDHPQYVLESGDTMSGDLTVGGGLYANGDVYAGTNLTTDNDFLFMDGGPGVESEYFAWLDGQDTFWTTNDLAINGVLQTGGIQANPGYNRFGGGTAVSSNLSDGSDVLVSADLDVGGTLTVGANIFAYGSLFVGTSNTNDDDYIFMDGVSEALIWREAESTFQLSDDLYVVNNLTSGGSVTSGGDFNFAEPQTFYLQVPGIDFRPRVSGMAYILEGTALVLFDSGQWHNVFYASLNLPQGAVINHIRFYFYDNDENYSFVFTGRLRRRHIDSAVAFPDWEDENDLMSEVSYTTSQSPSVLSIGDADVEYNVIDNQNYQYSFEVYCNADGISGYDLRFYGVRVEYTLQTLQP